MRADIAQISSIGQCILGDEINVPSIEVRVIRLILGGNETLTKDHIGRIKTPRIRSAKKNRILCHFRIDRFPLLVIERRCEHVMAKPVAEKMVPLLVVLPMGDNRVNRKKQKDSQNWSQQSF